MDKNYLKPTELAKYAGSTKRTIRWYNQIGLIKPAAIGNNGYKNYLPAQIIDLETIQLFQQLGFPLNEIKTFLTSKRTLKETFFLKEKVVTQEIERLTNVKKEIKTFYTNLDKTNSFVNPTVKTLASFEYYYLEKTGQYEGISDYFAELKNNFNFLPKTAVFFVAFKESFSPQKSTMRICVIKSGEMKPKNESLCTDKCPSSKVLSYVHKGSPRFLSLLWQELSNCRKNKAIKLNTKVPYFFEFYVPQQARGYSYNLQIPIV